MSEKTIELTFRENDYESYQKFIEGWLEVCDKTINELDEDDKRYSYWQGYADSLLHFRSFMDIRERLKKLKEEGK